MAKGQWTEIPRHIGQTTPRVEMQKVANKVTVFRRTLLQV